MTALGPTAGQRRLEPREKVVVIAEDPTSGATLGCYGTVVRVHTSSIRAHRNCPARWRYSVFVPRLQDCVDVAATSLFGTGELLNADLPCQADESTLAIEIHFHHSVMPDNAQVDGAYRLPEGEWRLFTFRKCENLWPSYQLSLPLSAGPSRFGELEFLIPRWFRLDKNYVLRAIAEVQGIVRTEQ